jgi:hypothetical protein
MAVQLIVRTTLAIIRRRAAAKSLLESSTPPAGASNDGSVMSGKKSTFTVDGQPLSTVLFDPDDPEQAAPYPEEEEGEGARDRRCTLCLGTRRDATATECGHVCKFARFSFSWKGVELCFDAFTFSLLGVHRWMGP